MKIIRFPGGHPLPARTNADPSMRLSIGPVTFTCTSCGEETSADFRNMVFRSLEFYCLACGSPFRITNPAFSACAKK
jgi:transcription elongation factor Elf1